MSETDNTAPGPTAEDEPRRDFLVKLSLGLGGVAALAVGVPVVSALLAPLLQADPQTWRKVGTLADFDIGSTHLVKFENANPVAWSGVSSESAAWLRRDSATAFTAFSVNCAHLGCPVRWEPGAGLFMCPCHGGIYYKDGSVAAGPPPRGLTQYHIRISGHDVELLTAPIPITDITAS
ncbi:ubiquinol-cytochrome c reductase iron-sulfur subunit [Hymenobacter sp. BRD67]|uniref:QcrA and Rieske domain-containing protein n=1 Tax=Hymenobacter sp. BRD67 TaxID=2675877 RepID=UPI0015664BDC|nr:Rieske (2Fe-2S) protein [Hymenobacter sp. BRD67]QKG52068.1 Rieske (2Fe-2S) protein [Hymenobacter sp. BRD67]